MGGKSSHPGSFFTFACQLRDFKLDFFVEKIEENLAQNANEMVICLKNVRK